MTGGKAKVLQAVQAKWKERDAEEAKWQQAADELKEFVTHPVARVASSRAPSRACSSVVPRSLAA